MIPTGTASLADIQTEFGGSNPIGLDEYYVGAGLVVSGQYTTIQGNPPSSGPISIADFRGVSKVLETYSLTPSTLTVTEGGTVTFTVNTTNVANGTVLTWNVDIGTSAPGVYADVPGDFDGPVVGSVTINSNTGTFTVTTLADGITESGTQYFFTYITPPGQPGNVLALSGNVSIQDPAAPVTFTFNDTVASNITTGYNLRNRAVVAGWNGVQPLIATVTVNSGVYVIGTFFETAWTTGNPALPAGSTVTLVNNGTIAGVGGVGGNGGAVNGSSLTNGSAGGQGGTGFFASSPVNVYNSGTIAGGGGGGGGGAARYLFVPGYSDKSGTYPDETYGASGGGGGGGRANGVVGVNGAATGVTYPYAVSPSATAGTLLAPGSGSGSSNVGTFGPGGGPGGAGGAFGQPGFAGGLGGGETTSNSSPGAGGAAGAAIFGGSFISWYVYGTRIGSIDHPGTSMIPGGITSPLTLYATSVYVGGSGITVFADTTFQPNGNIQTRKGNTTAVATLTDAGDWRAPNSAGIGSSYWIRFTRIGGSAIEYTGDTLGVWHSLSSNRMVGHSLVSSGALQIRQGTYQADISGDGGTTTLVSHTISVQVDYEL